MPMLHFSSYAHVSFLDLYCISETVAPWPIYLVPTVLRELLFCYHL